MKVLWVGLFSVALFVAFSQAQQPQLASSKSGTLSIDNDATIVSLLQQSHDLDRQFPLPAQVALLHRQAELAAEVRPDLGALWASEMLSLASQETGQDGSDAQDSAMAMLARMNPERALELLHAMEVHPSEETGNPATTLHMARVTEVLQVIIQRDSPTALPIVEREAAFLGTQGFYPYSELADAARAAVPWRGDAGAQESRETQESALQLALSRYSQVPRTYYDDLEFSRMLQSLGDVSLNVLQPALHLWVKNILATDTSKYRTRVQVFSPEGQISELDNAIDAALARSASLIHRDPDLLRQLESLRPELRPYFEQPQGERRSRIFFGGMPPRNPRFWNDSKEKETEALRMAHLNADSAIAKAGEIVPGPDRDRAFLALARSIAADRPEQARKLIAEVQNGKEKADDDRQFDMISAQAFLAAAQNRNDELRDLLRRGFALVSDRVSAQQNLPFSPRGLLQLGMQNEPDLTLAFLQALPPTETKALLLLNAASTLRLRVRLPLRFAQK